MVFDWMELFSWVSVFGKNQEKNLPLVVREELVLF